MTEKVKKLKIVDDLPKSEFQQAWKDIKDFDGEAPIKSYCMAFIFEDGDGQDQIAFSHSATADLAVLVGLATYLQHFLLNESADMADEYLH